MPAMMILAWVLVTARLVFTAADLQRKSVSPMPVVELESKQERTQTINTAPTHSHATELTKFRQEILGAHNFKRQLHKVPLLTEDIKLDKQAQSFAVKLAIQGNITHSPLRDRIGQGENIALRCALKDEPPTCGTTKARNSTGASKHLLRQHKDLRRWFGKIPRRLALAEPSLLTKTEKPALWL